jgi:hypothetical protein
VKRIFGSVVHNLFDFVWASAGKGDELELSTTAKAVALGLLIGSIALLCLVRQGS